MVAMFNAVKIWLPKCEAFSESSNRMQPSQKKLFSILISQFNHHFNRQKEVLINTAQIIQQINLKNVHPVSGAGILIRDLLYIIFLP